MSRPLILKPVTLPLPPNALVAVDRALSELRRGGFVRVAAADGTAALVMAAEGATNEALARLAKTAGSVPAAILTARRASVLKLAETQHAVRVAPLERALDSSDVLSLADPLDRREPAAGLSVLAGATPAWADAAVLLTKLARLLPAAVAAATEDDHPGLFSVAAEDVRLYQQNAARSLRRIAEARVPLADAEQTRIVAFRPADGGIEHLALVIGQPDRDGPVLARLHSECFTGDLLGSLRCDCGDQLRGAIAQISQAGGGVLLYLAQEGRGIGLVNKLRAYELQDNGFDTLDANLQLGFDDDERLYLPAAEMLRLLGITQVRLMTNNPAKVEGLSRHAIAVTERVPHIFPSNGHNENYLRTKATRSGHLF
ncbi:MAG TPA: GTP cyclohydrolase II [Candidatus Sulfotelmatobacter sp.]|jgi:GTP cyclohydrolase II|nr:GTP cyclohydrolase II [Candidatus Sulfotelmatobacter sp.]